MISERILELMSRNGDHVRQKLEFGHLPLKEYCAAVVAFKIAVIADVRYVRRVMR
jgi:hypothetical protein